MPEHLRGMGAGGRTRSGCGWHWGASRRQILRLVVVRGLATSLSGAAIGLAAAFELTHALSGMLYGVTATDPLVFTAAPLLMIGVSAAASYMPAAKAVRIDPLIALRYE